MASQHTAEEEEHLRTLTWLAYLEKQTHGSTMVKKKWEKGDCIEKKKLELKWEKAFSMVSVHAQRSPSVFTYSFEKCCMPAKRSTSEQDITFMSKFQ